MDCRRNSVEDNSMEKKEDRRIRKTREQLKSGLARLMQKKNLNEITVKELVDEADINRSTFYLHYSNVTDLLKEIETALLEEMQMAAEKYPIIREENTAMYFFEDVFQILGRNREITCALLGPNGDISFIRKVEAALEEYSRNTLEEISQDMAGELKYFYSFCMHGCLGFVRTWLEEGQDKSPEVAAHQAFQMVKSAMEVFCNLRS